MIPPWHRLNEADRAVFRVTVSFLGKRLAEQDTIDWALRLKPSQRIERLAIGYLLDDHTSPALDEPWATSWRLIDESWSSTPAEEGPSLEVHRIGRRLTAGDRSGTIISAIVTLVTPRLEVKPIEPWRWQFVKKPHRPKTVDDVLSVGLTSGQLIDLKVLGLAKLEDVPFLVELANALEAALKYGLNAARRTGWTDDRSLLLVGSPNRVYYTQESRRADDENEPDAYHRGIAPSVKLLHAVVSRIADLDVKASLSFIRAWQASDLPISTRLWASVARDPRLVSSLEAGEFVRRLDDRHFWDLHAFPEIAELRASRFAEFSPDVQETIVSRLRKGPPRSHWPKRAEADQVKKARLYWAVRELKRIEVAGGKLPPNESVWLKTKIGDFPDLDSMKIDGGFLEGPKVRWVPPNPDDRYDTLKGTARLHALEAALSSDRSGWDDDSAGGATDWLRQPERTLRILSDLEISDRGGDAFPRVWNRFGWTHSPREQEVADTPVRDLEAEANRVLVLLRKLSNETMRAAIDGISHWLDSWSEQVAISANGWPVWLRTWPIAVELTNAQRLKQDDGDLSVFTADGDREPMDLDTLNTPTGKLVSVFLSACPNLEQEPEPFAAGGTLHPIRDVVISAGGRSGLIAKHRLIEALPYFLRADASWTQAHLIVPLLTDNNESLALWRAIARRTHHRAVLEIIGDAMVERAVDRRLGRETRGRLVFSLVVESLRALLEKREPAVKNSKILQMLRSLDDEVRARAADTIVQFVREVSAAKDQPSAAELFRTVALPFLRNVWPQERSLATPGVSRALSDLPAASGKAFAEAVETIKRFLVPFDCWSMMDYSLYDDPDDDAGGLRKLSIIDDEIKGRALLSLLDLTVGSSEGSVVPRDLTNALGQIESVAPALIRESAFRRLSASARR